MLWQSAVEWGSRLILVLLIFLSGWSLTIIIDRRRYFKALQRSSSQAMKDLIRQRKSNFYEHYFLADLFKEISSLKTTEQVEKAFDALMADKRKDMEKGLGILGTLGSTTPFVGLLGTILGIIVSFGELSQGSGNTNSVMFSLAEALILTAVGLMVAIPAVVGFNYFNRTIKLLITEATALKDLFIAYKE